MFFKINKNKPSNLERQTDSGVGEEKKKDEKSSSEEMLSSTVHQIKTPLVGIKWTLSSILNGGVGQLNDAQKTLLEQSYESNERAIELIDQILSAGRLESGRTIFQFRSHDVMSILYNVLYQLKPNAEEKKIKIKVNVDSRDIPKVSIDSDKIYTVFQCLIENAIKYTSEEGRITVGIKKIEGGLEIFVSDTGIGIPEEDKDKLFKKFYRASNAHNRDATGFGLGLFTANNIVEKHGGKMWFDSKEGKGSTFYFTLPMR